MLTSVTTRVPRRFSKLFGEFRYRHVKEELFSGYQAVILSGEKVLLATPEKALLDFFHLSRGEWTTERLGELRLAPISPLHWQGLETLAERLGSPRVKRALSRLARVLDEHDEGVEL